MTLMEWVWSPVTMSRVSGFLSQKFLRYGDDLVEHDGVVDGAFPVEGMAVFVHKARFKHQEKAFGVLGKHGKGGPHGVGEIGLDPGTWTRSLS